MRGGIDEDRNGTFRSFGEIARSVVESVGRDLPPRREAQGIGPFAVILAAVREIAGHSPLRVERVTEPFANGENQAGEQGKGVIADHAASPKKPAGSGTFFFAAIRAKICRCRQGMSRSGKRQFDTAFGETPSASASSLLPPRASRK